MPEGGAGERMIATKEKKKASDGTIPLKDTEKRKIVTSNLNLSQWGQECNLHTKGGMLQLGPGKGKAYRKR